MKYLLFLLCLLFVLPVKSSPQEWRYIHPYKGVNIYTTTILSYDNNIFKYSKNDIDKFVDNIEPYKYPIETYDDLITTIQLHSKITSELIDSSPTTFNLKIKGNLYLQNKEKDYESFSISIYQKLARFGNTLIKYLFIPEYFIRYYPDFDIITPYGYPYYTGCYFSKHYIMWQSGYKAFGSINMSVFASGEKDDYNSNFDEYDTQKAGFGFSVNRTFHEIITPSIFYSFTRAIANATDESGENKDTSDDSDISNDEDEISLALKFDLTNKAPLTFLAGFRFTRRVYTTDKPILCDPYHSGREDVTIDIDLSTSITPTPRLTFDLGYTLQTKTVSSPFNITQMEEIKNYSRSMYSAAITFSY